MTPKPFNPSPGTARLPPGSVQARWSLWLLPWLALAWLWLAAPAQAGTVPGELPGFVGRLSTLQGDVRWYDRDSAAWLGSPAQPLRNWPLAAGDRLRTGTDARAELRVGGTTVRLGADVDLTLQQLDEQRLTLWLQSGSVAVRLPKPLPGDATLVELQSPEGRWLPLRPGHYRLERLPDARTPATQATVWRGELRFEGPDSVLVIPAGRRADLWQDRATGATRYAWAPVDRDAFADWVARDERQDEAPITARHVPPGMSGWQDLDRHGDWIDHPEAGSVWQPRVVAPGWAPFHDGRWAWVAPWGWTWIDAAPWGFAPFHYGSWLMLGGRWCWAPGPRHLRPHFAPVLSGWVSAPHIGVGIQIGGGPRPPPPRVVIPSPPPSWGVVLPPPRGREHRSPPVGPLPPRPGDRPDGRRPDDHDRQRPDLDRLRPGWQQGRAHDEPHDRGERGDHRDGRDGPGRTERHDRPDGLGRPQRPDGPERDRRTDRPDRHHWAERVDRAPPAPAATVSPAAPVSAPAPVGVLQPQPPVGPAPTAPGPVRAPIPAPPAPVAPATVAPAPPAAPAPRAEGPRLEAPRTELPRIDAPGLPPGPRPETQLRPERPERPERGDGGPRHHRQEAAQAWR